MTPGLVPPNPVQLHLSAERAPDRGQQVAGGTVLAVVPADAPWYADRLPGAVVQATRNRAGDCALEHLRLTPMRGTDALPGLRGAWPSLVADSVGAMFRAGAPSVDVLLVRARGAGPADLTHPVLREQLLAYLPALWGGIVCVPDLVFAPPRATTAFVRSVADAAAELFLVLCLDTPPGTSPEALADACSGADAAVCTWAGEEAAIAGHRWRSAAAVVAGLLTVDIEQPGRSLCRRRVPLLPPRWTPSDRRALLTPRVRAAHVAQDRVDHVVRLEVDPLDNVALVRSEPALRRPVGAWPLPALFTAKFVRRVLFEAADRFVFRPVNEQEAIALGGALGIAMRPFVQRGLLVGAGGAAAPTIETAIVRDPTAPGLAATVTGFLRPWMQRVSLQVHVRNGERPSVLEA